MSKCECWHETPNRKWADAECWGTREREPCSCDGDQTKCDFYPEYRERAKSKVKAKLVHTGPAGSYEGEIWECSACGFELVIPEDHDLPDTCSECGAEFSGDDDAVAAAIAYYNRGIREDIFSPEVATYARLAVEALKKMGGNA